MPFPTSVDVFPPNVDHVDWVSAADINALQTAIVALETYALDSKVVQVTLLGDGSNEQAAINAGILAASVQGGGRVQLTGGKTASFASSLLLKNDVHLDLNGSTLKWTGAVGGSLFTSAVADPLLRAKITGGRIDPQTSCTGFGIDVHSPQACVFDVEFLSGSATFTVMRWAADATNASGYDGTRNAVFNKVPRFISGICGTGIRFTGQASGAVTDSEFGLIQIADARVAGIVASAAGFVDTLTFGEVRIKLGAANAIGVDEGENNASTNIYNWTFESLAVDDPSNLLAGLTGIALRNSNKTVCTAFYPQFTAGTAINKGISGSWYIVDTYNGAGPGVRVDSKGWSQDAVTLGDNTWNNPYLVNAGLFKAIIRDTVGAVHQLLTNVSGEVRVRNAADSAYVPFHSLTMARVRQAVAFATPYTPNAAAGDFISFGALTGNLTINAPTGGTDGQVLTFFFVEGGAGGFTITWDAAFVHSWSDVGNTVGKKASIQFMFDGTQWNQIGAQRAWA